MNVKNWSVCVIEPNRFEGQIILDLLRNAGVDKVKVFADSAAAMATLELSNFNIIIGAVEMAPIDGPAWTRQFRRNSKAVNRQAPVFLTSRAFSRSIAEDCRHAGANALIGKPLSAKILIATINKVLAAPRPFIDAAGYVGPCRRAGIVTAGPAKKRRQADETIAATCQLATVSDAIIKLSSAVTAYLKGEGVADACEAALRQVQAYAVNSGDGPLMRTCNAFALQLGARNQRLDAAKAALAACMAGVAQLAEIEAGEAERREQVAEGVRQAVARAASQKAA